MDQQQEKQRIEDELAGHYTFLIDYFSKHIPPNIDLNYFFLKAHLLAEYYLNHLLVLKLDSFGLNGIEDLTFHNKLKKLRELKVNHLDDWVIKSLFKLNRIRNNLSHSLEYNVNEADVDSLGFYLGKEYIYRKLSKKKRDLKDNSRWIILTILSYFYKPIAIEIIAESLKREKKSNPVIN